MCSRLHACTEGLGVVVVMGMGGVCGGWVGCVCVDFFTASSLWLVLVARVEELLAVVSIPVHSKLITRLPPNTSAAVIILPKGANGLFSVFYFSFSCFRQTLLDRR